MKIRTIGYEAHIITILNGMVYLVADTLEDRHITTFHFSVCLSMVLIQKTSATQQTAISIEPGSYGD